MGNTFQEIEDALTATNSFLPQILAIVSAFYPPAGAVLKFLPLIQVALQGVQVVQQATGGTTAAATAAVSDHLTPGQPAAAPLQ
jgi:hypothetical protein